MIVLMSVGILLMHVGMLVFMQMLMHVHMDVRV
jgi:hypothetical protein